MRFKLWLLVRVYWQEYAKAHFFEAIGSKKKPSTKATVLSFGFEG